MSDAFTAIAPDALFVVACPVCQGQVAAVGTTVRIQLAAREGADPNFNFRLRLIYMLCSTRIRDGS